MANKRTTRDGNIRLQLDYREYMRRYELQKQRLSQKDPVPTGKKDAQSGVKADESNPVSAAPSSANIPEIPLSPIADQEQLQADPPSAPSRAETVDEGPSGQTQEKPDVAMLKHIAASGAKRRDEAPIADDNFEEEDEAFEEEDVQNPFSDLFIQLKSLGKKTQSMLHKRKSSEDDEEDLEDEEEIEDEEEEIEDEEEERESLLTRGLKFIGVRKKSEDEDEELESPDGEDESGIEEDFDHEDDEEDRFEDEESEDDEENEPLWRRGLRFIGIRRIDEIEAEEYEEDFEDQEPDDEEDEEQDEEERGVSPKRGFDFTSFKRRHEEQVGEEKGDGESESGKGGPAIVEGPPGYQEDAPERNPELFDESFEFTEIKSRPMSEIDPVFRMDPEYETELGDLALDLYDAPQDKREDEADEDDEEDEDEDRETISNRFINFFHSMKNRVLRPVEDEKDEDEDGDYDDGGDDIMADDQYKKSTSMTDLMAKGLEEETPALSRRERKARAAAMEASAAKKSTASAPKYEELDDEDPMPVDEPTQEFKPVRPRPTTASRPVRPKIEYDEDDMDDDDDDDLDDDLPPVRRPPMRRPAPRIYSDDDDDYDDDDYDDYDEDEDIEDDDERMGVGHHILGFLKALLAVILIVLVLILTLRLLESGKIISLNGLRNTVGTVIPLEVIFPAPTDETAPPPTTPTEAPTPVPTQAPDEVPGETSVPNETEMPDIAPENVG